MAQILGYAALADRAWRCCSRRASQRGVLHSLPGGGAGRRRREDTAIRLTSATTLLGVADPVRVSEDFACLDLISRGRAEITVGRSAFTGRRACRAATPPMVMGYGIDRLLRHRDRARPVLRMTQQTGLDKPDYDAKEKRYAGCDPARQQARARRLPGRARRSETLRGLRRARTGQFGKNLGEIFGGFGGGGRFWQNHIVGRSVFENSPAV